MTDDHMKCLENEAREGVAEAARLHAERLPAESEWKAPLIHLANRLAGSQQGSVVGQASST
jgi:hypothetical protein